MCSHTRLPQFKFACHAGLTHKAVVTNKYKDLEEARGAQCFWPQPKPDTSLRRYAMGSMLRDMMKQGELTDLTLRVEGGTWEVHRLLLADCSPFFRQSLTCISGAASLLFSLVGLHSSKSAPDTAQAPIVRSTCPYYSYKFNNHMLHK